jgi:Protein of unknown function (DUF3515)
VTPFHRRRPGRRLSGRAALLAPAVAVLAAAGCAASGTAETIAPPRATPLQAKVCGALHKALPATVGGAARNDPRPASPLTAAWGSGKTAVVLRCGIPKPKEMDDPNASAVDADGVTWLFQDLSSGPRFTTTYREAYVQVDLGPDVPDGTLVGQFAKAVEKTDPSTQ